MAVQPGIQFKKIDDYTVQTAIVPVRKEGYVLQLEYVKGVETKIAINITCYFNETSDERILTETDVNGNIIKWERYINTTMKTSYPIRLPGRCEYFNVIVNFITGGINEGTIIIGGTTNSFYA